MAEAQGIKLFGQTIVLQVKTEEPTSKNDQKVGSNNKRPDKVIPCPRCKSMETKFCYFNNYNVNQPRHFCKGCQRYWTAGGALRNVPVGAGRRKSKPPDRATGFDQGCLLDAGLNMAMAIGQFDLNGVVVDEWQLAAAVAASGGFRHEFQFKRRKNESPGQTC